jgi:hypothetical protein
MRSIAVWSVSAAVAFVAMGAAALIWWYAVFSNRPIFKSYPPQTMEFVRSTSDIEHLRNFTQLIVRDDHEVGRKVNAVLDLAINVIAGMAFVCAYFAVLGWVYAHKAHNLALGKPVPRWLRWL